MADVFRGITDWLTSPCPNWAVGLVFGVLVVWVVVEVAILVIKRVRPPGRRETQ